MVVLDGQIQEVMPALPQMFLVKSVDAISWQIEKLVEKSDAHIESKIFIYDLIWAADFAKPFLSYQFLVNIIVNK